MLILTRKSSEELIIGNDISITILEIKGNHVVLGIKAPEGVKIYRKELYEKIRGENVLSSGTTIEEFDRIKDRLLRTK